MAAACDTVNVRSPMVTEPVRALPAFAETLIVTMPGPVPVVPEVTDIQGELLDVSHGQPLGALTATFAVLSAAGTSTLDGSRANRQGAAAWLKTARWPFTVTLPSRELPSGLGAAWNATAPLPCPEAGESPEIQAGSADAVHVHSAWVPTAMLPGPPAASSVEGDALTETSHFAGVGPTAVVVVAVEPQAPTMAAGTIASRTRTCLCSTNCLPSLLDPKLTWVDNPQRTGASIRALVWPRGARCACQTQVSSGIKTLVTPTGYEARLRVYGRYAGSEDSVNPAIHNLNKRRRSANMRQALFQRCWGD